MKYLRARLNNYFHSKLSTSQLLLTILSFLYAVSSYSFPEMIRHGYVNCTACHISPGGGGALTQYGRKLSRELLSVTSYKTADTTEENSNSKSTKPNTDNANASDSESTEEEKPEPFHFGGEARLLSFYHDNEFETQKRMIPMQLQADAAYNAETFAFVGRLGLIAKSSESEDSEGGGGNANSDETSIGFQLPTAYGLYRFEEVWSVRAGRFTPTYGLVNAMHFLGTRGGLGFGFDDQRAGVELSRLGETFGFVVSAFGPRNQSIGSNATSLQLQYSPTESSKIAMNVWNEKDTRNLFGVWFVTPIYGPVFLSADWNRQKEISPDLTGYYRFTKLGYEVRQGVNIMLISDNSQRDLNREYTKINRAGPGIQYYPMQFIEIELAWLKETNHLFSTKQGDYAYLLMHAYY